MKKFIFSVLSLAIASAIIVSCDDDSEDGFKHDTAPAKTCAGVYTGQWILSTLDIKSTGDTVASNTKYADGTITLVDSSSYVIGLDLVCSSSDADFSAITAQTVANIQTLRDKDYCFSNRVTTNGLGMDFYGEIVNQELNMYFSTSAKLNRTTQRYTNYHFVGNK